MKLNEDLIDIDLGTQKIGFSTWPSNNNKYANYLLEHTFTIPIGSYTRQELEREITIGLNRTLYGDAGTGQSDARDEGAEIFFSLTELSRASTMIFALRSTDEFCAPPVDATQFSSEYTYTVAPGPPALGTLTRTSATSIEVDGWFQTDDVFSRGSGRMQFQDQSTYQVGGTWTGGNTWTSSANFLIADLGFQVGDTFTTIYANASQVRLVATTIAQGGPGGARAVITVSAGAIINATADVIRQNGIGWVCGLINPAFLSDPANILSNIEYGIALPNRSMVTATPLVWNDIASVYYVKSGQSGSWGLSGTGRSVSKSQPIINTILGKRQSDPTYKLHFEQKSTAPNTVFPLDSIEYTYGNYAMVLGHCTQNGVMDNIKWCQCKLNDSSTTGFYATINPDVVSRDDGLVVPRGPDPDPSLGLGFWPTGAGGADPMTLVLFTRSTASLYGYADTIVATGPVSNSSTLTVALVAENPLNPHYSFGDSIYVDINLPLNTYVDGQRRNVVDVIPFGNTSLQNDTVVYNPPYPVFINLENKDEMTIPSLNVKLFNDQRQLIDPQISVTLSLLFRDGE
jgi:hypothetical protein